jgi:hypothetical protein
MGQQEEKRKEKGVGEEPPRREQRGPQAESAASGAATRAPRARIQWAKKLATKHGKRRLCRKKPAHEH